MVDYQSTEYTLQDFITAFKSIATMADRDLAKKIFASGLKVRARYPAVHDPRGLVASPVFRECSQHTVEHLLDIGQSRDAIIAHIGTPDCWKCGQVRAKTAAAAISIAEKAKSKQADNIAAGTEITRSLNLPALSGTVKQVAWASAIRAQHAARVPESKHLFNQKRASWWIDNRHGL